MKQHNNTKQRTSKCAINPATVYLESLAPTGKRSMRCQLQAAIRIIQGQGTVEDFKWQTLTYADVVNVRARLLEQNKSIHTVNLCLAAVRGVAQCAFHLGVLSAENLMHIKSVKRISFHPLPSGRSLSEKELKRLLKQCQRDHSARGRRDSALIATLATTGLRRAEIAALTLDQYDQKVGQLRVTNTKNQRDRLCPLPSIAKKTLRVWLNKRGVESVPYSVAYVKMNKSHSIF